MNLFDLERLRKFAPRTDYGVLIATIGDNVIIAPPAAGIGLVICELTVQNESATPLTALLKKGAGDANPSRVRCSGDSSGVNKIYVTGNELRLPAATGFFVNLSAAANVGVSVRYFLEYVATGIPV